LKRRFRLTRATDFERVRRFGKSYAHPLIVLITLPNEMDISRFASGAGRSLGNSVQRNRAKRILREIVRQSFPRIAPGWDVILLARKPMSTAGFKEVEVAINNLLIKANLLEDPP
jgi:ribonuclease P protein component